MKPLKMLVLCGGRSAEHSISLVSAWNLLQNIHTKYNCTLIAISENGSWYLQSVEEFLNQSPNPESIGIPDFDNEVFVRFTSNNKKFYNLSTNKYLPEVDIVFPLLHGTNGEDGNIQAVLNQMQLPYIGCSLLSSALCMDKDVAKRLMIEAEIPTSNFITVHKSEKQNISYEDAKNLLGEPMFVKPANLGSSVGISKVSSSKSFDIALNEAFLHDSKIIIEEFIDGKEVECAVLGNNELIVSKPGCYIHSEEFFDYDTKYLKNQAKMEIPASFLTNTQIEELRTIAQKTYKTLECSGLARVDIFVTDNGDYYVNEVNTMPGFTQNSMYPLLLESTGLTYVSIIDKLTTLAIEDFELKKDL